MLERSAKRLGGVALAGAIGALALMLGGAGGGAAAVPGCGKFAAQADAQDAFMQAGGKPGRNLGGMDGDRDGVACEQLPGPYKGYATVGYHRGKGFFYGVATMPSPPAGGEAPCLLGNKSYPDAPRRINVFRVHPDGDKPLLSRWAGTQALPETGRLQWKITRANPVRGNYYAVIEERVRLSPDGRNQCPSFSSHPTSLPRR